MNGSRSSNATRAASGRTAWPLQHVLALHEQGLPVHRIAREARFGERQVRRIIRSYQDALASGLRESNARTAVFRAWVRHAYRTHSIDEIGECLGLPNKVVSRLLNEWRPARGEQGAKTLDATVHGRAASSGTH
jgi:hypothetical protein